MQYAVFRRIYWLPTTHSPCIRVPNFIKRAYRDSMKERDKFTSKQPFLLIMNIVTIITHLKTVNTPSLY